MSTQVFTHKLSQLGIEKRNSRNIFSMEKSIACLLYVTEPLYISIAILTA